mgnify:CR=1 FL=1
MLSRFAPNDIVSEELKLYPLTMYCFIKKAQECTKLFFYRYLIVFMHKCLK